MYKGLLFTFLLQTVGLFSIASSTDTLKLMHYNILQYGNYFGNCTTSNNNLSTKDGDLNVIIDVLLPDIFTVNEMGCNNVYARRIVQNSLNKSGRSYYEQATFSNNVSSSICNMLFYNSNKLGLIGQDHITQGRNNSTLTRQIDIYHLYYKDPNLSSHMDSIKLSVIVCHLNAGVASERENETYAIAKYLADEKLNGNVVLCGDLNIDGSGSSAYQNLIANSNDEYSLVDPIDQPGSWSNNGTFKAYHTQSTRTSGSCGAGGGMDDRFDFILMSNDLKEDSSGMSYIADSYEAVGQDAQRFNGSLISPANSSYNSIVIQALYDMSDHLPVMMELEVEVKDVAGVKPRNEIDYRVLNKGIEISNRSSDIKIEFFNLNGQLMKSENFSASGKKLIEFPASNSILICRISSDQSVSKTLKILPQL